MNMQKIITFTFLSVVLAFASSKTISCSESINALEKQLPQNSAMIRLTIAEARTVALDLDTILVKKPEDPRNKVKASICSTYIELIKIEISTQKSKNNIQANHKKQLMIRDSIEHIQERIAEVRSGKVSNLAADLNAERAKLARTNSAMDSAMLAVQAREEASRRAAIAREDSLNRLLAEERAKAEARQNEARSKLNDLQSKLIQVTQDARGIILSMSDILFDVDKATLKEDLKTSLAKVAGILSVYQELNVSVEGHTDNTGSAEHNMKLSEQRAKNVLDFLVSQGIEAQRLSSKGYGMTMPVADNSSKEGRQKNRRVDLVIKDKSLAE